MRGQTVDFLIDNDLECTIGTAGLFFVLSVIALAGRLPLGPLIVWSLVVAFITGLLVFLVTITIKNRVVLEQQIIHAENELKAIPGLQASLKLPLKIKDWAISAEFLEQLMRELYTQEPALVLECGSGTSTVVIAACLRDIGKGKVISLDHKEKYAGLTRNMLQVEGLSSYADVLLTPLHNVSVEDKTMEWYGFDPDSQLSQPVDMLIVDGPPANINPVSRYPAVPLLHDKLAGDPVIMLDDTDREGEQEISRRWQDQFNLEAEHYHSRHSFDVLRRNP